MCLDLVAKHFALCSSDTVTHSESPCRFTDGEGTSWLFLPKPGEAEEDGPIRQEEEEDLSSLLRIHTSNSKWRINSYNKSIVTHPIIAPLIREGQATFDMLYTMSLSLRSWTDKTKRIPADGWYVEDGADWFATTMAHKANLVAFEDILVIRNATSSEVGGFISTLRDEEEEEEEGSADQPASQRRRRVYVSDLFVFPQYRRKGLATVLLHAVYERAGPSKEQALGAADPTVICLTVFCENSGAVAAYFKEGFKVDGIVWIIAA